jgi:hypothetical protein
MKDRADERPLPEHKEVMDRFARKIVDWRMTAPAILFLESAKPLSFLGNQALVFFQPIVQSIFNFKTYDEVVAILEDRDNLEYLLSKIEEVEAEYTKAEKEKRKRRREEARAARTPKEGGDERDQEDQGDRRDGLRKHDDEGDPDQAC